LIRLRNSAWFSLMSRNKAGFCLPNSWSIGCCVPFTKHPKGIPKFRVYSRWQWRKEWWYPFVHHTLHPFARDTKRPPHVHYQYIKQRCSKDGPKSKRLICKPGVFVDLPAPLSVKLETTQKKQNCVSNIKVSMYQVAYAPNPFGKMIPDTIQQKPPAVRLQQCVAVRWNWVLF
jgi:hypothetical protein